MFQAPPATPRSKRLFDVVGAIGGLIAFSPVMAVIAGAILVEDGRPILFRQERLGRTRRPFTIVKFRSMRGERVTRVGHLSGIPIRVHYLGRWRRPGASA